ncbi:MAG: molybdate ABC transporter substrate-binding protein [Burkholderiaceae bacterium]|jgi:molybdate transport system substrate-binding protein
MKKLFATVLLLVASIAASAAETTVFAAASLTDALTEIGKNFSAKGTDTVRFSFAASSTLAKQIESGAPVSVFISADEDWMNYAETRGFIASGTRSDLLANALVLIEPADHHTTVEIRSHFDIAGLLAGSRLAMGDPESVPAGKYGKEALTKLGVWDAVKAQIAPADSVRSALALVERGETPFGIVYSTDAAIARSVRIAGVFPEDSHKPIVYPVAIVKSADSPVGRAFLAYLKSSEAQAVFQRFGFRKP